VLRDRRRAKRSGAMRIHRFVVLICVAMAVTLAINGHVLTIAKSTVCDPDPPLSGVPGPPEFRYDEHYSIPILMYHQIDSPARGLTVTPEDFASQMDLLKEAGYTTVSMDEVLLAMAGEPVPLPPKAVVLTFDDGYDCLYRNAHPILKERDFTATMFLTTRLIERSGYLTWEQISTLAAAGYTVGCHTRTHLDLCTLSRANLEKEVQGARQTLREKTGQTVLSFCYPSGRYNSQVIDAVRAAGFMGAVTTEPGVSDLSDDPYALKRIRVDGRESLKAFAQKLGLQ
jgi:peptidoglycan/xylan/chitin deacetylase (PgdA/CDA1 family)